MHILHKTGTPYVEIGTIESITNIPMMYYPNMTAFPIDVSVRVGDKVITYQQIPANMDFAEVTDKSTGDQVFISCSKDSLNAELQSMRQKSIDAINSVEYHKQRIKSIDSLVGRLNPEIAEKQQQAQEISDLKNQLASMQQLIEEMRASSSKEKED